MKIPNHSDHSKSSSSIKSNIIKSKAKILKVSKLSARDKKNLEEAKNNLQQISGSEKKLDNSFSSSEESVRELSLSDIMRTINELTAQPDSETECISNCSAQMVLQSDIFWTSPTAILRAIKYCILRRNWENITYLLLFLLQHKDQYVQIVHKLCIFISRFNPMIRKLGLLEDFKALKEKKN